MNHTCLCLPSRSWYSFTDRGRMEGREISRGKHMAGRNICILMQDYNSLHIAVMSCATLVNTQTDCFWQIILLALPDELKQKSMLTPSSDVQVEVFARDSGRQFPPPVTGASPMECGRPSFPETQGRSNCVRREPRRNTDQRTPASVATTALHTSSCMTRKTQVSL